MHVSAWYSPRNLLVPLVGGIALTVTPFELWVIGGPLMLAWIVHSAIHNHSAATAQLTVVAIILVVAYFAPVKQTDYVGVRRTRLPKTSLTLGELEQITGRQSGPRNIPVLILWRMKGELRSTTVEFPREELLVRDLIAGIEAQSPLRHRFAPGCLSGATLLFGAMPWSLSFRDPHFPYCTDEDEAAEESAPLSPSGSAR
jgi:hypothetical protein